MPSLYSLTIRATTILTLHMFESATTDIFIYFFLINAASVNKRAFQRDFTLILLQASWTRVCGRVFQFDILLIQYNQITVEIYMGKDKFLEPMLTDNM